MFEITKQFHFEAGHWLNGLPEGHKCGRYHGHSYRVRITLASPELDATGFVADFGDLAPVNALLKARLDHQTLNDLLDQPSSELLAQWIFQQCQKVLPPAVAGLVTQVAVSETATSWALYREHPSEPDGSV
ncbi:6-pyruvoyl trahydropterin synthase family protein [Actinomadura rupiterrae]|uniref:6-pyruvoyl trahydropterin synthase family protein n=1 Tax=Actinomadura rupiterrae TaxID=559627 RepID=UPI0020A3AA32|nr:6-carboxytetrahydropterin synthase [Actinomadura rupiterrae]MCP2342955.1 6-pyruvoyltetrahydropterin/6-carboxytetrahydropterin synthase [Actinomadura rupiterrae]